MTEAPNPSTNKFGWRRSNPVGDWRKRKPIQVQETYHKEIQKLVEAGLFSSMGEAVEYATDLLMEMLVTHQQGQKLPSPQELAESKSA